MADDNATPMTDSDIDTPPADTQFQPAAPLKDAGIAFDADAGANGGGGQGTGQAAATQTGGTDGKPAGVAQSLKSSVGGLGQQANDKARQFIEDGKGRATDALGQLSQMLNDAADQVDAKLGAHYGEYARNAAGQVQGFAETIRNKDPDVLIDEARGYVRKSPAVAVGVAAVLGFVVARLVQSGLDSDPGRA